MTDLKELIEREIDQYLEWPTADKSHVTTVSAKLFAEHVATLYADHIAGAGKMAAPAVQGGPTDAELLDWAGEEQFFLFCDKDDFLDIARSVLQRYVGRSPDVQGEPVADGFREIVEAVAHIGVDFGYGNFDLSQEHIEKARELLKDAPQPAEQQPELAKYQPCGCVICTCEHETQCQGCGASHCGTHPLAQFSEPVYQQPAPDVAGLVEALELALEYWRDRQQRYKNRKPRWVADAETALATYRKQQEGEP